MQSDGLYECKKCSLIRNYDKNDDVNITTDFKCIDSWSEYWFRTCSVATSLVTSLILLLCRAAVNTEWFRNHSSFEHRPLPLLVNTQIYGNHEWLLVRIRSKLVVLLNSPYLQRLKFNEPLLLLMKWTRGWWLFIFSILLRIMQSVIFILFYFTFPTKEKFFSFPFRQYTFLNCK